MFVNFSMPTKDKRKLAAIMFADVVGYSRMMASNEERTLELLVDFENICSPIISENEGEIIKKVGDELFCEFSSAKQAVDSALAIQEAIQPYNDSRPKDFKLQVRIGIHVGDIVLRDGDVFGDGVNVASRIQPFASPGGICVSNAVRDALSSHPNYDIQSEGKQELKNIIEKHTLYRVKTGFEDKTIINKYKKSKKTVPVLLGIVAICIAGILFFGDSLNIWNFNQHSEEPLDSYYLHFTSTGNYIDYLYKYAQGGRKLLPFIVDSINTPISSIEDTMLYNITGDCFSYLNQQFQNKGTEIFANFKESHTSIMDNFPFPTIIDTSGGGSWYPYPIQQFSQIFNVDENNIPKVFMQILIYKTKNYNTGNEKLFKEVWWKIKREDNLSWREAQFYDNNESGYKNLIKDLKEELLADINRLRFSSNPFFEWVGEIEEILPNNKIKIKYIYESNSIKNNLLLDAQTMYSHSVDGDCKEEICIVGIKELLDDIQLGITYIEENKSTVPDSLFDEIYKLKQDFTRYEKLLDSLIQNDIHAPEHNWLSEPFYTVKVLEVFGNYAVCKLHTKNKPWAKIKVGHKLRMHK